MVFQMVLLLATIGLIYCSPALSLAGSASASRDFAQRTERVWPRKSAAVQPTEKAGKEGAAGIFNDVDRRMEAERRRLKSALTICRC
jgi:hypothetical protein